MSCACQTCGKQYKVDIIVPDGLWEKIKPSNSSKGGGAMCGSCIMKSIEDLNRYGMFELIPDPDPTKDDMEEWERGFTRNESIRQSLSTDTKCE